MATLRLPDVVPSPTQDSERLRVALQGFYPSSFSSFFHFSSSSSLGWGVDQEVIIWILGHRKAVQRKKIKETYQQLFKESIIHCLQSTLSGVLGVLELIWYSTWYLDPVVY
ncbi:Annexin D3 [Vitis vinifera]|uniref:Annexin D3 n=1 Tax=Vitis vinifera TaxID=29760 RepID=A0A438BTH5_VITVI|nr:Annexin D3 [Vitis vinifera]